MRRRDAGGGRFLTRTPQEWREVLPRQNVAVLDWLPKLAGATLAAAGRLDAGEVARLGRIAAGVEVHRTIDAEAARRILARRQLED